MDSGKNLTSSIHVALNDLSRVDQATEDELIDVLRKVIRSGKVILGPYVEKFEEDLSRRLDNRNVISVANGTDALKLALRSFSLPPGSLVATAANAGGYASVAILENNLTPLYVDVDENLQLSHLALERAFTEHPGISAVVHTHLFGTVGKIDLVSKVTRANQAILIEDCAQALGAKAPNGSAAGTFGHASTFSFYPTKNLGAIGDGGAISFDKESAAAQQRAVSLRQYGWRRKYEIDIGGGVNSRMDEIQAAFLSIKMLKLDSLVAIRRALLERFSISLGNAECRLIGAQTIGAAPHLAVLFFRTIGSKDAASKVFAHHSIETTVHYPLLDFEQRAFKGKFVLQENSYLNEPNKRILTIPLFPEMTECEIDSVCEALRAVANEL